MGWEDPSGGEHGNPLWKSCLEFPLGQRSLVGYSAWGRKESDTTEWLSTHTTNFVLVIVPLEAMNIELSRQESVSRL